MLFGSQFPNVASVTKSGPFTLLSADYSALSDLRPSVPTLFQQTTTGTQTLVLTKTLTNDVALDINTTNYPYVIVGVVNIGNSDYDGQILPACTFSLNGKWGAAGSKFCQASVGPTGYASAWAVFKASEKSGATPTTIATASMAANFQTAFANFGLGELIVIGCDEIPISSMSEPTVNQNQVNASSSNVPNTVLRNPSRQLTLSTIPLLRADTKGIPTLASLGRNVRDALYAAMRNGACLVAPEWRNPGTSGPDLPTMMENCFMANLISPNPSLAFNASDSSNRYRIQLAVGEML